MAHKVFISKHATEVQELNEYLSSNGDRLIAHSFLHFEKVPFVIPRDFDVIFFGSPRAVVFFKAQQTIPENVLIACTGAKTAELLKQIGSPPDFVGKNSGNISEVAQGFKAWCGECHVLFPTSDLSLKSISNLFPDEQKSVVVVYKTELRAKEIETSDTYVFTSPSNVNGFLDAGNQIESGKRIIAWGESTAALLTEKEFEVTEILSVASIGSLIQTLSK